MTLVDHQTGEDIISPYLLIGANFPASTKFAVNTNTFRRCQDWLILPETMREEFLFSL